MTSQTHTALEMDGSFEREHLEAAFRSFSQVSSQLANSFDELQGQVSGLQQELEESNQAKMRASRDKDNLAARLENLLALLPGGVVVLDSYGYVEQCNPQAKELLGNKIEGRKWTEIIKETFSPRSDDGHEISLKDGRRVSIATRSMTKGDPELGMSLSGIRPGDTKGGTGQIILLTDQTETRELQSQLARRDRLGAIGKMVAYLAHQIRTPLSSAMLYGGHLKNPDLDTDLHQTFAERLLRQLRNVERQISDLLIFARGSSAAQEPIRVTELFSQLRQELDQYLETNAASQNIQINYFVTADQEVLNCNPEAFISAIINLVNNAREASQDIASQDIEGTSKLEINISVLAYRGNLKVVVSDSGPGVSQSDINKILEPFYTTKTKGTGLGLAVVQAVIKSLDGNLTLSSSPGQGLSIYMEVPLEALPQVE